MQRANEPIDRVKATTPPPAQSWLDVRLSETEINKAEQNVMRLVSILNDLSLFKWGSNQILGTALESKYANLTECMRELFSLLRGLRSVAMADFLVLDENGMIQKDLSGAIKIHTQINAEMIAQLSTSLQSLVNKCRNSKKAQKQYQDTLQLLTDISKFSSNLSRSIDDATLIATQTHYKSLLRKKEAEQAALKKERDEISKRFDQFRSSTNTGNNPLNAQYTQLSALVEEKAQKAAALEQENADLRLKNKLLTEQSDRQREALAFANTEFKALKTELSKPIPEKKTSPSWRPVLVGGLAVFGLVLLGASLAVSLTGIGAVIGIPGLAVSIGILTGTAVLAGAGALALFNLKQKRMEDRRFEQAKDEFRHKRNNFIRRHSDARILNALNHIPGQTRDNSVAAKPAANRKMSLPESLTPSPGPAEGTPFNAEQRRKP